MIKAASLLRTAGGWSVHDYRRAVSFIMDPIAKNHTLLSTPFASSDMLSIFKPIKGRGEVVLRLVGFVLIRRLGRHRLRDAGGRMCQTSMLQPPECKARALLLVTRPAFAFAPTAVRAAHPCLYP